MNDANFPLQDQVALVTGANSGIGEAIARCMAEAGAAVGINYVSHPEAAGKIVEEIKAAGGKAIALQADVSKEDQVKAMFEQLLKEFDTIDIMVNNAGLQRDASLVEMTLEQWRRSSSGTSSSISISLLNSYVRAKRRVNFCGAVCGRRFPVRQERSSASARCIRSSPGRDTSTMPGAKAAST